MREKIAAVILAGGRGSRMQSDIPKQYIKLGQYPVLYYSIKTFEESGVDEIILVSGENDIGYCKREIVDKYGFKKVTHIVPGGRERYHSVYNGLKCLNNADYVLIHDGARPMVSKEIILNNIEAVKKYKACVTAVPSKDTIKLSDGNGFAKTTPDRKNVWIIQTPQTFEYKLIMTAYSELMENETDKITDDAMVVETFLKYPVRLVEGDYKNIKVTTPEDLVIAQYFVGETAN